MKVDWVHAEFSMGFDEMGSRGGGQWIVSVPTALAIVTGAAGIHVDQEDGARYVSVGGIMNVGGSIVPGGLQDYYPSYWPYGYTGWPVIAAIPGDIFNADTAAEDPDYEHGGKYIESAMIARQDPDWPGPYLQSYSIYGGDPEPLNWMREGQDGAGGSGPQGVSGGVWKSAWNFRAVSQRCWVLILIDPAGHREIPVFNPEQPTPPEGDPIVISRTGLTPFTFQLIWRLGAGSGVPGMGTVAGAAPIPSTVST